MVVIVLEISMAFAHLTKRAVNERFRRLQAVHLRIFAVRYIFELSTFSKKRKQPRVPFFLER